MPFGLCKLRRNLPEINGKCFAASSMEDFLIYLDDIVIFAFNFDSHMKRLRLILNNIRATGLKLSVYFSTQK